MDQSLCDPPPHKKARTEMSMKLFNDPIHGTIELNDLEQAIINTPEFYRLKDIKQLGGRLHVYPGATHTRFEHSIGVCYIAGEFIQHLRKKIGHINENREKQGLEKLEEITEEEEYCVRVAALCHDLGHGAFSHLFESIAERIVKSTESDVKVLKHEDMSKRILRKIYNDHPSVKKAFEDFGLNTKHLEMIKNMIGIEKGFEIDDNKHFLYEIVANKGSGVDVDKWDYFARDCHYLGVTNDFNWRRCMKFSTIVKDDEDKKYHIGFAIKEKDNLMGMFRTRSVLHQRACQHNVAKGIQMMIADILVHMKDEPMIRTENNNHILYKSLSAILQEVFKEDSADADLSGYLALTDSILDLISNYEPNEKKPSDESSATATAETSDNTKIEKARELLQRIKVRDLYKCKSTRYYPKIPSIDEEKKGMLSYLVEEKKSKSNTDIEEELTEEFRTFHKHQGNKNSDFQIKLVTIRFASEKKEDPLEDVLFFHKKAAETEFPSQGYHIKSMHQLSHLDKPKVLVEYRLMLYSKKSIKDEDDTKLEKSFDEWIKNWRKEKGENYCMSSNKCSRPA